MKVTFDGLSDVPELQQAATKAAVCISGSQISRQATIFTLLNENFNSVVQGAEER